MKSKKEGNSYKFYKPWVRLLVNRPNLHPEGILSYMPNEIKVVIKINLFGLSEKCIVSMATHNAILRLLVSQWYFMLEYYT